MKISIKSSPSLITGNIFWLVKTPTTETAYPTCHSAFDYARRYMKRHYKESAAYSRVLQVSTNLLTIQELELVQKLLRNKCKGITSKQYGYLAGIYERQQREW